MSAYSADLWARSPDLDFFASSAHAAVDPAPGRGPIPEWVQPVPLPSPDPARAEEPMQVLLLNGQTRMTGTTNSTFFEMALVPQTVAGLQGSGTLALPWNVERTKMTIHAISIVRNGTVIDLLPDANFTVLHRENDLEKARFDGTSHRGPTGQGSADRRCVAGGGDLRPQARQGVRCLGNAVGMGVPGQRRLVRSPGVGRQGAQCAMADER